MILKLNIVLLKVGYVKKESEPHSSNTYPLLCRHVQYKFCFFNSVKERIKLVVLQCASNINELFHEVVHS